MILYFPPMSMNLEVNDLEFQKVEVKEEDKKPFNLDEPVDMFSGMDVKKPQIDQQPQIQILLFGLLIFINNSLM